MHSERRANDRRAEVNRVLDNIERCLRTGREITVTLDSLRDPAAPDTRRSIRDLKLRTAQAETRRRRQVERRMGAGLEPPPAPAHQCQPMSLADPVQQVRAASRYDRLRAGDPERYARYLEAARARATRYHARRRAQVRGLS